MSDLNLTPRQQLALRSLMALVADSLSVIKPPYGDAPTDTPQSRGLRRVDALREKVLHWAERTDGVEPYSRRATYGVVIDGTAFVIRKAGRHRIKKVIDAKLPFHRLERERCLQNVHANGQFNLFGDKHVSSEAERLEVRRFVHLIFVGDTALLQAFAGERTGRRAWASYALLLGEVATPTGTVIALGDAPQRKLTAVPVASPDDVPGGLARFTEDTPPDLQLGNKSDERMKEETDKSG